jgi:hypothetical protein
MSRPLILAAPALAGAATGRRVTEGTLPWRTSSCA